MSRCTHHSVGKVFPFYGQLLNDAPLTGCGEIFVDGFTSGETLEWLW